jgi:phosphate uptake regulator
MKRKIVRLGSSSLVASLPSKWAERFDLKPGDELEIEEQGNKLVIYTDKEHKKETKDLTLDFERPKYLKRVFAALYKKGYEEIILRSKNPKIIDYIQSNLPTFIGVEVIDQGKDYVKLSDIVSMDDEQFDNVFRRCMLISVQVAEETIEALKTSDSAAMQRLLAAEKVNNKLTDFCKRLLAKKGYKDELRVKYLYALIQENERIVDEYKYVAKWFQGKKVGHVALDQFTKASKLVRTFYECYYTFDEKKVHHIVAERQTIEEEAKNLMAKSKGADAVLLHHAVNLAILVYEMAEPFLEMYY